MPHSAHSQHHKKSLIFALTADFDPETLEKISNHPFAGSFSKLAVEEIRTVVLRVLASREASKFVPK